MANAAMSPPKLLPEEIQANKQVDDIVNALGEGLYFEKETIEHKVVDMTVLKPVSEKVVKFSKFHFKTYLSPEADILREPGLRYDDGTASEPTAPRLSDVILQKMDELEKDSAHDPSFKRDFSQHVKESDPGN